MLLLLDANVLIDYLEGDLSVLGVAARHLGPVHVPAVVLDEVLRVDRRRCEDLGIKVVDPSLAQLVAAGEARGRLSFEDHVCLLIARDKRWTCVTNDSTLRRECRREGVTVLWGLQLMSHLVAGGHLARNDALGVAERIHRANPRHITEEILARFRDGLDPPRVRRTRPAE